MRSARVSLFCCFHSSALNAISLVIVSLLRIAIVKQRSISIIEIYG